MKMIETKAVPCEAHCGSAIRKTPGGKGSSVNTGRFKGRVSLSEGIFVRIIRRGRTYNRGRGEQRSQRLKAENGKCFTKCILPGKIFVRG